MRKVFLASSFKRSFKRVVKRRPDLKSRIEDRLRLLAADPFSPLLQTHRLKGKLSDAWACSVEYDCRIVFNFVESTDTEEKNILLIDIGSHDEVY